MSNKMQTLMQKQSPTQINVVVSQTSSLTREFKLCKRKLTCASEIDGNFFSFGWPTGPPHNLGGPFGSFGFPGCCLVCIFYFLFDNHHGMAKQYVIKHMILTWMMNAAR